MALPVPWVDKIFAKLTLVYGRDFVSRWEGVSVADVKTDWGHELAGFEDFPDAIAFALRNLPPEKPPTVLQFRDLARKAPAKDVPKLPEPKADPERVAAELAKLAPVRAASVRADSREWAKRILARHEAGVALNITTLRFAREALGIAPPEHKKTPEETMQ